MKINDVDLNPFKEPEFKEWNRDAEDMDISRFLNVISQLLFRQVKGLKNSDVRIRIQTDNIKAEGFNYTDIEFDLHIDSWELEEHEKHTILVINRNNLNEGTRLDLDITAADIAFVVSDGVDNYQCIQIDGTGIWFQKLADLSNL